VKLLRFQVMSVLFLAAVLSLPAWASNTDTNSALPGTLNYVEGQAQFNGTSLNSKSVGQSTLEVGQTLKTQDGKAELLLTPGVFLRSGENTSVKMIADSLTNTELDLVKGHAMVEVTLLYKQNDIRIQEGNAIARLIKTGLYDFDLNHNQIRVLNGEAIVKEGDREITLKGNHEISLTENAPRKTSHFDKKAYQNNDLYAWNSLRSTYLAEANIGSDQWAIANGWYGWGWGPDWWGPGWWGLGWGWGGWWGPW
jgi:FecR protein